MIGQIQSRISPGYYWSYFWFLETAQGRGKEDTHEDFAKSSQIYRQAEKASSVVCPGLSELLTSTLSPQQWARTCSREMQKSTLDQKYIGNSAVVPPRYDRVRVERRREADNQLLQRIYSTSPILIRNDSFLFMDVFKGSDSG